MSKSLVVVSNFDPGYLAIFEDLARKERALGRGVIALDLTRTLAAPPDSYHRGVLRVFGLAYPGHDIRERFARQGIEYADAVDLLNPDDAQLNAALREQLEIAVESALITYLRTDRPDRRKSSVAKLARSLEREGWDAYCATERLLEAHPDVDRVFVANGRFPHQKLVTLCATRPGIEILHIEKGDSPGRAYVQAYAPQNRLKSQAAVSKVLEGHTDEEISAIADTWLTRRAPSADSHNEFSALWSTSIPQSLSDAVDSGTRIAGFFTSSQDEFQFLGPEWHLHTWTSQFDAFDTIMTDLESEGFTCYLRVHPNLATKADDCFKRERDGVRQLAEKHPDLRVIWHDNDANTYALLEASEAIVVWYSTVGLEASARGLPVWTTATSRYGLVADVRELLGPEAVDRESVRPWAVDTFAAKRFIAYLVLRDQDIDVLPASWIPWDSDRHGIGARLAAIAVSGGVPGAWAAVRSLLDVYRHRSFAANRRARGL